MLRLAFALLLFVAGLPAQFQGLYWRFVEDHGNPVGCQCPYTGVQPQFLNPTLWFPAPEVQAQGSVSITWATFDPSAPVVLMLSYLPDYNPPPIPCMAVVPNDMLVGAATTFGQARFTWQLPTSIPGMPPGTLWWVGSGQALEMDASQPSLTAICSSFVFNIWAQG